MRLVTPYAPGSFLKPCVIISTVAVADVMETALLFVEALNVDHAFGVAFGERRDRAPLRASEWIIVQKHETREAAIQYHLTLIAPFKNGGSQAEWDEGWEPYLELYEKWCPSSIKKR